MIVDIAMFNTYSGNHEDAQEAILLKETFLASAQEVVTTYLGFSPELRHYEDVSLSGSGSAKLYVGCRNISSIASITVSGISYSPALFTTCDDHIRFKGPGLTFSKGQDNILLSFTAGWKNEEMPAVIILSILRIATLMQSETDGNIGLTGKSFADNSRTFINYSNYRKYLQPLDGLRIVGF